jgi:hypothetical protein
MNKCGIEVVKGGVQLTGTEETLFISDDELNNAGPTTRQHYFKLNFFQPTPEEVDEAIRYFKSKEHKTPHEEQNTWTDRPAYLVGHNTVYRARN